MGVGILNANRESEPQRGSRFARDLTLVVVLKVVLIAALYVFLLRPTLRPAQDPAATAAAVAGATTATASWPQIAVLARSAP
jgi:uncharacterized membrane protein